MNFASRFHPGNLEDSALSLSSTFHTHPSETDVCVKSGTSREFMINIGMDFACYPSIHESHNATLLAGVNARNRGRSGDSHEISSVICC